MFNDCEMFRMNLCLGCVGLAEKDWAGKYCCTTYNAMRKKVKNGYRYTTSMQKQEK